MRVNRTGVVRLTCPVYSSSSSFSPTLRMIRRPLAGITVVALEQAVSAPLCTRHLADLGARVVKIERKGEGDYLRTLDTKMKGLCSHFVWANRGKESICVDLKQPQGWRKD